jgi:hypothetical protein
MNPFKLVMGSYTPTRGEVIPGLTPGTRMRPFAWRTRFAGQFVAVAFVLAVRVPTVWNVVGFIEVVYVNNLVLKACVVRKVFWACCW